LLQTPLEELTAFHQTRSWIQRVLLLTKGGGERKRCKENNIRKRKKGWEKYGKNDKKENDGKGEKREVEERRKVSELGWRDCLLALRWTNAQSRK